MKLNPKFKLKILPQAYKDISTIWAYTSATWGDVQADVYHQELTQSLERLIQTPFIGVKREIANRQLLVLHINKHTAYYQVKDNVVLILRILHQNRDVVDDDFARRLTK